MLEMWSLSRACAMRVSNAVVEHLVGKEPRLTQHAPQLGIIADVSRIQIVSDGAFK